MTLQSKQTRGNFIFYCLLILILFVCSLLILSSFFSTISYDDTLYLTHIRLVMDGKIPYRDFFDSVPPVWMYLYSGVFLLFGESITVARSFSLILGIFSVLLLCRLSGKISGKWGALLTLALLATVHPALIELTRLYYASSALFYVILGLTIEEKFAKKKWSSILVGLLFTLATGTIQAFGLLIFVYPIYLFFIRSEKRAAFLALAASAISGSLIAFPFLLADLQSTIWSLFYSSQEIIPMWWDITWKTQLAYIPRSLFRYSVVWLPIIAAGCFEFRRWWKLKTFLSFSKDSISGIKTLLWLSFIVIAFTVYIFNPTSFMQQHAYYLPMLCILVADYLVRWLSVLKPTQKIVSSSVLAIALLTNLLLTYPAFIPSIRDTLITPEANQFDQVIKTTSALIANKPDVKVFSFIPYIGLKAGGEIFPGTEFGVYSFSLDWSDEKARERNFFTGSQVMNWINTSQPEIIVTTDKTRKSMNCCGPRNGDQFLDEFEKTIPEKYDLKETIYVNSYWGEAKIYQKR